MKFRKILSVFLTATMISAVLAGCSGNKKEISNEALDLSIFLYSWDAGGAFNNDWIVFKEAEKMTNVKLTGTLSQATSDAAQEYNTMLASGDMADIIQYNKDSINKYALEGAFVPLDDLIEKYAPNIKKFLEENPFVRKGTVASDGKLYMIPRVGDGEASHGWFIRQDWLDALGLQAPKTLDEYYKVLKAFKVQDPNKNGQADEIPFFFRGGSVEPLFSLFGANFSWYAEDGKVYFGRYENKYKTAIENIAKWYKEGLIDPEIYTRGSNARDILFSNNTGGSTHDWFGSTASYNESIKDKVAGFKIDVIAPPADLNGKVWTPYGRALLSKEGWGISSQNKYPEETIKYFDFWFTEEGRRLYNYGVENVHYTMVDGKPKFKDEMLKGKEPVNTILYKDGAQLFIGAHQNFDYEEQWLDPIAKKGMNMYIDNDYIADLFPALSFTPEEQKVISTKWPSIDTYIKESEQKWILGASSVENDFDAYISKLKEMGMDEIVNVYNSAYQRYMAS